MRLGWSQHGEKSLKFHSINSIVEYAREKKKKKNLFFFFLKQKYINPLLTSSRDTNVFVHVSVRSQYVPHRSGCDQSEAVAPWKRKKMVTHSSIYSNCFSFHPGSMRTFLFTQIFKVSQAWICKAHEIVSLSSSNTFVGQALICSAPQSVRSAP